MISRRMVLKAIGFTSMDSLNANYTEEWAYE
jgi:hypothetical protein